LHPKTIGTNKIANKLIANIAVEHISTSRNAGLGPLQSLFLSLAAHFGSSKFKKNDFFEIETIGGLLWVGCVQPSFSSSQRTAP